MRNPEYDEASDESGTRSAYPDKIVVTQGLEREVIGLRLIADTGRDRYAVTDSRVTPADYTRITGSVADRSTLVDSAFVVYLQPNFHRMKNLAVRRGATLSTDVTSWTIALGGDKSGTPARSVIHPNLFGYLDNPNFTAPPEGDVEGARALLDESG